MAAVQGWRCLLHSLLPVVVVLGTAGSASVASTACVPLPKPSTLCPEVTYPTTASSEAAEARVRLFVDSLEQALASLTCPEPHGVWTCDDCREAYRRWACAQSFPACSREASPTCPGLCRDVAQKCPLEIDFSCPVGGLTSPEGAQCQGWGAIADAEPTQAER